MITLDKPLWMCLRPERLEDFIGCQDQFKALLNLRAGVVLFVGRIGCGKTSAALALARTVVGGPVRTLGHMMTAEAYKAEVFAGHWNAQDFNVDWLKDSLVPMWSKRAILILDEAQDFTAKQQNKIQSYIEADTTYPKLVCLCTYEPSKLQEALQNRCTYKVRLGPLSGADRVELARRGWKARGMEGAPPQELFAEFDRYGAETTPRDILNAVDHMANGFTAREAVKSTRPVQ